ncbi:MAG: hypothetical protein IK000_01175 [Bacteroidaceae bacterium]|nr:hypothetical protein [Bacteroidaceae bacterium]
MRCYLFLLSLFISLASFAEGRTPSVVQPVDVDTLAKMALHINYFNKVCPQEKVYLHLDNTAYFQGETIWYAANVVNASTGRYAASKVLYVELLSPTGVILKQQKLKVVDGRCHGSFSLVDTSVKEAIDRRGAANMPSGYYQIRAYTRAMLNFDEACIYSRVVPVYQFPKREGNYDSPVVGDYPYHEVFRPASPKEKDTTKIDVKFFPEGGHLISGIPCSVAFKATDSNGLGIDIDSMRTADGKLIRLSPQHKGMGRFEWLTNKGGEKVTVFAKGNSFKFSLPKSEEQGCALHISCIEGKNFVQIDAVGLGDDTSLAYTLTGKGNVCAFDTLHFASNETPAERSRKQQSSEQKKDNKERVHVGFVLPTHTCPTGVCQFTLFDSEGGILAQRMLFVDNGVEYIPVTFTASKPEYLPFEQMQMTFHTGNETSQTFSVAVRDASDYGTAYRDDIRTYMLLSSELKGLIEEPGWYFEEETDDTRAQVLDLLMMVQGWTRYNWRQMAGVEPFQVRHYTEEQLVIDGWAFSRVLEKPLQNTKVEIRLYSRDGPYKQNATVTTDTDGYWSVGLDDFEGRWDLYIHTEQDKKLMKNAMTRIRLGRSYKPPLRAYAPIETFLPDPSLRNAALPVWREDINDFLMPHDAIQLEEVEVKAHVLYVDYGTFHAYDAAEACEDLFDEGDFTYNYSEYLYRIGFFTDKYGNEDPNPTLHKYVCEMGLDGRSLDHWHLWMTREKDMEYIHSVMVYDTIADPRVLPCFQQSTRNWEPYEIQDLLRWIARGDKFVIAEVVYADTGFSDRRENNQRYATFNGYYRPAEFYAPTYPNGPVQGDKDYRRTLYWNPEVTTDETGRATVSFYNNGYSRAFTVSAEGLTKEGIPIINQ